MTRERLMKPQVKRKLQEVVYHRVKMWDAAREAEFLLKETHQVSTSSDELDSLAAACGTPDDAFDLEADDLEVLLEEDGPLI